MDSILQYQQHVKLAEYQPLRDHVPAVRLNNQQHYKHFCFRMIKDIHCVKSVRIRSYSVQMRENTDQNNSKYGRFSRID